VEYVLHSFFHEIVDKVCTFMKKVRTLKGAALLRKHTDKKAILRNDTRWSSAFQMLSRYNEFSEFLSHPDFQDLHDLLLSPSQLIQLRGALKTLKDFEKVTKALQSTDTTIAYVQRLFMALISKYPEYSLERKLGKTAEIICDPTFENAVVNIIEKKRMTSTEKNTVRHLIVQRLDEEEKATAPSDDKEDIISLASRTKFVQEGESFDEYGDLRYILPTSNHVERLFSAAGRCMDDYRHRMLPVNFEMQMFLSSNSCLWNQELFLTACKEIQ
jgi:hypothetical protein